MFNWLKSKLNNKTIARSVMYDSYGISGAKNLVTGINYSTSGELVNDQTVWQLSPFTKAAELISNTIARVARKNCVYYDKETGREKAKNHAAQKVIARPQPYWQGFTCWKQVVSDGLVYGNGYLQIKFDGAQRVKSLKWLSPLCTYPIVDDTTNDLIGYRTNNAFLYPWEVIHYRGLGCRNNPWLGMAIYDRCRESLGWGLSVQKYGSVYMAKEGKLGVLQFVTDKDTRLGNAAESMGKELKSLIETGAIPVFDQGAQLKDIPGPTAEQAQLLQSLEQVAIMVANVTGLPAYKLGAKVNNSYGSTEAENLALLSELYDAILCNLEGELNLKLLTEAEQNSGSVFIEFNRDVLLAGDKTTESQRLIAEYQADLRSWEETRIIMNLPTDTEGEFATDLPPQPEQAAEPVADQPQQDPNNPTEIVPEVITEKPEPTADIALMNGAQVQAAQGLLVSVAAKELPPYAAEQLLIAIGIPADIAAKMAQAAAEQEAPKPEPVFGQAPEAEPAEPQPEEDKAEPIVRAALDRLITRISKDGYSGKEAFLNKQLPVFRSALPGCEKYVDQFFEGLTLELDNVLPEQRQAVLESLSVDKEYETLCKIR